MLLYLVNSSCDLGYRSFDLDYTYIYQEIFKYRMKSGHNYYIKYIDIIDSKHTHRELIKHITHFIIYQFVSTQALICIYSDKSVPEYTQNESCIITLLKQQFALNLTIPFSLCVAVTL